MKKFSLEIYFVIFLNSEFSYLSLVLFLLVRVITEDYHENFNNNIVFILVNQSNRLMAEHFSNVLEPITSRCTS